MNEEQLNELKDFISEMLKTSGGMHDSSDMQSAGIHFACSEIAAKINEIEFGFRPVKDDQFEQLVIGYMSRQKRPISLGNLKSYLTEQVITCSLPSPEKERIRDIEIANQIQAVINKAIEDNWIYMFEKDGTVFVKWRYTNEQTSDTEKSD